jgi:hypothetical protein
MYVEAKDYLIAFLISAIDQVSGKFHDTAPALVGKGNMVPIT